MLLVVPLAECSLCPSVQFFEHSTTHQYPIKRNCVLRSFFRVVFCFSFDFECAITTMLCIAFLLSLTFYWRLDTEPRLSKASTRFQCPMRLLNYWFRSLDSIWFFTLMFMFYLSSWLSLISLANKERCEIWCWSTNAMPPYSLLIGYLCSHYDLSWCSSVKWKVSSELLKHGTLGPVSGKVRMNFTVLCLLFLDHVWRNENFVSYVYTAVCLPEWSLIIYVVHSLWKNSWKRIKKLVDDSLRLNQKLSVLTKQRAFRCPLSGFILCEKLVKRKTSWVHMICYLLKLYCNQHIEHHYFLFGNCNLP